MKIKFETRGRNVTCVLKIENGSTFVNTQRVHAQADRVDGVKRAKQQAFSRCMYKALGCMCDKLLAEEVEL